MPSLTHIHTFRRFSNIQYMCDDPHCTCIMEKKKIKGKASLCAVCKQNEIILTAEMLKLARPACKECSNTKEAREFRARRAVLESLIPKEKGQIL